jgi:hypothetical protein
MHSSLTKALMMAGVTKPEHRELPITEVDEAF